MIYVARRLDIAQSELDRPCNRAGVIPNIIKPANMRIMKMPKRVISLGRRMKRDMYSFGWVRRGMVVMWKIHSARKTLRTVVEESLGLKVGMIAVLESVLGVGR